MKRWQSRLLILGLGLALSSSAFAQYGGGTGGGAMGTSSGRSYGSGTGIAIGAAAAAGVGVGYLVLRNRGTLTGCVRQSGDGGNALISEKDKNSYALLASKDIPLAPGERVALKGKKSTDDSGKPTFEVQKLVKSCGACK